jgi:hypothetical protein
MKKAIAIILSVMMSLMVVTLGGGVAMVKCQHTGLMQIVQMMGDDDFDGNCCKKTSPCMEYSIEHLSPTLKSECQVVKALLPGDYGVTLLADVQHNLEGTEGKHSFRNEREHVPIAPPRLLLNLNCVLVI